MQGNGVNGPGKTRPRRLLLCLDGVPCELITAAKQRGLFDSFGAPARLLSPFPTLTNVALSAMFGASPPQGYESLYFDKDAREFRGGIRKYIGRRTPDKMPSSYMDELDYQEPLAFEFLVYVAPEKVWRADMRRFHERFCAAPQNQDYFAFLKGTDGLMHIRGPERLSAALESLDRILIDIQTFCGRETEIVLFSDHGMNLYENRRVHLQTHLQRLGFKVCNKFAQGERRSLAIAAFGLCGYAAIYCHDADYIPEVAANVAELEGVDFSIYADNAAVILKGKSGSARIECKHKSESKFYRYLPVNGDPLSLNSIAGELRARGALDEGGFASDATWLEATAAHIYPDVLANLYSSLFTKRVQQTADVLISFQDGYYFGWSPFGRIVRLAATHGNALSPSSTAFLMSTHRILPDYVRADDAGILLRGN
jgi:hypothetical protein